MTKTRSTKKALLLSAFSLLICFSMLIGTTFAWFTDSVTSANNIIKSGNLDVELYYQAEGQGWKKVEANTNVFKENALWEPGHTEVVKLKVVNEGSLALKYNLGVNVASEVGSINVDGDPFKLSDSIKFGIVDGAQSYTREQAVAAVDATAKTLKTAYNSGSTKLLAGKENVVTMVVYMPTTVGNEANYAKGATVPTINLGINLFATQVEAEADSFDENYDKDAMTFVATAEEAQDALDNATAGTIIKLAPGVDYGTLYLRPVAGSVATKEIDWIGNNYRYETYSLFKDLTIVGALGAIVDNIKIEGGTYYNTEHSQNATYPVMLSLIELKNVVIDGVTFTGNGGYDPQGYGNAINLSGNNIKVDGLTIKNCVLDNANNNARLLYKTESTTAVHNYTYGGEHFTFVPSLKNITVTGTTFNGGYMGLELRETENVTITNNVFNVADRNILLPVNSGCTYTGNITITGNVSNNAKERFVRMSGAGAANVVIKNNVITNYLGEDADYIKVTDSTGTPVIENNTMTRAINADSTTTLAQFTDIFANGGSIFLKENVTIDTSSNKNITVGGAVNIYADDNVTLYFPKTTVFGGDGTITVHGGKITTPQELCISGNSKLVIDGGEHTFGAFSATGNGTIVVNDGVLNCKGSYAGVMGISFGETGSLYVNGGKLNMYQPFNLNANRCDKAYIEINGGTIELLGGMADMFVVRNVMDKDVTSGVSRGSSIKITGGTFIAHYEIDSDNDATAFIRNGDPNDTNKVLVSNIKDKYNCVVTGGTFYGSWQRADNTRYENSDGLMVYNSIEGFVANGYQITGNPDDGYVVSKS